MYRYLCSALLPVSILLSALATARAASYTFTTINIPNSLSTEARGINTNGQIVGTFTDAGGKMHGFVYDQVLLTTIDVPFPGAVNTQAYGINNHGQIVGVYCGNWNTCPVGSHGFLYDQGVFTQIDVPLPNVGQIQVSGINDNGQIVGFYVDGLGTHGFLLFDGTFTTIDVPGSSGTSTRAINNQGEIVGTYRDGSGTSHVFLLSEGTFTRVDVPNAAGFNLNPFGINDRGQISGSYTDAQGKVVGFVLWGPLFTKVDVPGSLTTQLNGINNQGQLVGTYFPPGHHLGFLATPEQISVEIDVKTRTEINPINPGSKGKILVAILTTDTFDATTVNGSTVRFGRSGREAAPLRVTVEDVNRDARFDLLLLFNTQDTGIQCGERSAFLTGQTSNGQEIQGSDSIKTVGCK